MNGEANSVSEPRQGWSGAVSVRSAEGLKRGARSSKRGARSVERGANVNDTHDQLMPRTKQFGLRTLRLYEALPRTTAAGIIGKQLLRSAFSVGANYRAARRAKSRPDFISKLGTVEEEADESLYWMEMLVEAGLVEKGKIASLMEEASAITAMVVASIRTVRARSR